MNDAIARSSFLLSSVPQSSQSSLTKIRSWKEIWMARNIADLRDEIMIRDRCPSSARMRASFVHRSSSLSDFQRIFCHRPWPRETASRHSRPSSASKSCLSASSSLPFHVIVFALLYSNERPYTNPGWPVHSRRRICYMQEVFFFYARERLAFSPDRCVFCFVLAFTFLSFFFWRGTPCGERGVHRDVQMRTSDSPCLGGRGLKDGLRVHDARTSSFVDRGHEPRKFRVRPDAAGTEIY